MDDPNTGNIVDEPIIETPASAPAPETPPPTIDDGGIEVVVGEETPAPQPPPKPEPDPLRNKVFAQDRILNNMRRTLDETTRVVQEQAKTIAELRKEREEGLFRGNAAVTGEDEVDQLVKAGKWKDGVKLMIKSEAAQMIAQQREQQNKEIATAKQTEEIKVAMDANIKIVSDRHPELNDGASEKWQVYDQVLNENPRWRNSPDGPLLAMYVMEERMKTGGIAQPAKPAVVVRPGVPVGNTSLPAARPAPASNKVTLTAEQKSFCDDNQIPYEDYAKSLGLVARGEGKVGMQL